MSIAISPLVSYLRKLSTIAGVVATLSICVVAHAQDERQQDETSARIRELIAAPKHPYLSHLEPQRDQASLRALYERSHFRPLWLSEHEVSRRGILILQTLRNAGEFGLRPDDYDSNTLVYRAIDLSTNRSAPASSWADLDVGITLAITRMTRHLHFGRIDPRTAGFNLSKPRAPFDVSAVVSELGQSDDPIGTLSKVEPRFMHYQLLKATLHKYRLMVAEGDLPILPAFKPRSIKPGEPYDGAAALRTILIRVGDLPEYATSSDTELDATLVEGLKKFQSRHGLAADGALGRSTFTALNIPLSARVRQLEYTLERWRWLPEFDSPPIIVNVPQFKLFGFRSNDDRANDVLQMNVIVGKTFPKFQTPVFTAEMKYIVFRPYWEVPPSITNNEMLPDIQLNASYLTKHDLEIVSASDGNAPPVAMNADAMTKLSSGQLRLRQKPGNDNSLGLVKLMLPNPYNVYLHSTPAKRLFAESRRAFSHGCIRVSDPAGLVEHALRDSVAPDGTKWTREKIEDAMNNGKDNQHVFLSKAIPVFVVYGTAMTTENGEALFFEDIYGHDEKLRKLLASRL